MIDLLQDKDKDKDKEMDKTFVVMTLMVDVEAPDP
jgi:hypothetical protein